MTTITPEQFMAAPSTDEDDDFEPAEAASLLLPHQAPLESIAQSLKALVVLTASPPRQFEAELVSTDDPSALLMAEAAIRSGDEAYADLEDKHRALFELLTDVEKIVKPSTSKLANAVRDAVTAWRNPEVPAEDALSDPAPDLGPKPGTLAYAEWVAEQHGDLTVEEPEPVLPTLYPAPDLPAADAPVEVWQDYAVEARGAGTEVYNMNRSQIRTLLGLPHFDEPAAG